MSPKELGITFSALLLTSPLGSLVGEGGLLSTSLLSPPPSGSVPSLAPTLPSSTLWFPWSMRQPIRVGGMPSCVERSGCGHGPRSGQGWNEILWVLRFILSW